MAQRSWPVERSRRPWGSPGETRFVDGRAPRRTSFKQTNEGSCLYPLEVTDRRWSRSHDLTHRHVRPATDARPQGSLLQRTTTPTTTQKVIGEGGKEAARR